MRPARSVIVSTPVEILRSGARPYDPGLAGLLVVVNKHRFLRKGRLEKSVYDPGVLRVEYRPARALLDWTALNTYLDSFRSWDGSSEAAVTTIAEDLRSVLAPRYLLVNLVIPGVTRYSITTRHGGVG